MDNELVRKVEKNKEIQKVKAIRIIAIPKPIKAFCVKPYLENPKNNMPPPHYNSRNSGLYRRRIDYRA